MLGDARFQDTGPPIGCKLRRKTEDLRLRAFISDRHDRIVKLSSPVLTTRVVDSECHGHGGDHRTGSGCDLSN